MTGPSPHVPEASLSAEELVKRICTSSASMHNKAITLQLYFDAMLNEELELLATHTLLEMEIDARVPFIQGAISRGDLNGIVSATVSVCRRKFAKLLRDHERDAE